MLLPKLDLFINLAAGPGGSLLHSAANLTRGANPVWSQNDKFTLRLWFLTPGATSFDPPTLTALADDAVIVLGGRPAADLDADGLLFSATSFTKGDDGGGPFYATDLNLNTASLGTALTGQTHLAVLVDVEIQNADNTERLTVPQFAVTILRDVVRGDEGVPLSGDPIYPVPAAIELIAHKGVANGYPALDSTGKIPAAQLQAVGGIPAEAAADLLNGQPVYLTGAGHLALARANSAGTTVVIGLAAADTLTGIAAPYIESGNVTLADWTSITGTASLTVGAVYYLAAGTAGQLTATAPTTGGSYVAAVGIALNPQTLRVSVQPTMLL